MKRLLVAEDDLDDRELFKEVVDELGRDIDLTIVENGEALLSKIETFDTLPDLIILDQNMPRLKGSETIVELRKNAQYGAIPMVIYTTYHDPGFTRKCQDENIDLFLKPDTFKELKKLMEQLFDKYFGDR